MVRFRPSRGLTDTTVLVLGNDRESREGFDRTGEQVLLIRKEDTTRGNELRLVRER